MEGPTWRDSVAAPGLWIRQRWWSDKNEPYDGPQIFEVVLTSEGFKFIGGNNALYTFEASADVTAKFYGPIPKAVPQ